MSNVEVYIVVEGRAEQTFVRDILAPDMAMRGVYLYSYLIGNPGHKGGDIRFERAKSDIGNFLRQRADIYVSTMFDYYGIDADWPGKEEIRKQTHSGAALSAAEKAERLEEATRQKIAADFGGSDALRRFIPYISMHEFEALLFSEPLILAEKLHVEPQRIAQILAECGSPEEINDRPETAPSKRIVLLTNGYRKIAMGKTIAESIGIPAMRRQCPHFDQWLTTLEQLPKGL